MMNGQVLMCPAATSSRGSSRLVAWGQDGPKVPRSFWPLIFKHLHVVRGKMDVCSVFLCCVSAAGEEV